MFKEFLEFPSDNDNYEISNNTLDFFSGLHYNGLKIIDFKYDSDDYEDFFLNYFKLFTIDFIVPTQSTVHNDNYKNSENFYFNPSFNDINLTSLFDIIYKTKDDFVIYDAFNFTDEASIKLQNDFTKELKKLDLEYAGKNINIPVCVLFKYIQHRVPYILDINLPIFHINEYNTPELFKLNMANIIHYNEDVIF